MASAPPIPRDAPVRPRAKRQPINRPDGWSDEMYSLVKDTGNASVAGALMASDTGTITDDKEALADLLNVNKAAEDKAFKRLVALQTKLGKQIQSARDSYVARASRTRRLFKLVTGVDIVTDAANDGAETGN